MLLNNNNIIWLVLYTFSQIKKISSDILFFTIFNIYMKNIFIRKASTLSPEYASVNISGMFV